MGDVEDKLGRFVCSRNDLETAWPAGFADASLDGFRRNEKALVLQLFRRGNGKSNIPQLMAPDQR